jgi:predicted nucleic-acid-binding Zn-ribbon protein
MPTATTCERCGSTRIIPRARVIDRGEGNHPTGSVQVGVERKPDALFFTAEERVNTFARICGECGFTELFAEDPAALYDAYLVARASSGE